MNLIEWTPSMCVQIGEIDEQHQKLVEILNGLYAGLMAGKSNDATNIALKDLYKHMLEHFSYEEELMARAFFPGLVDHKKEHDAFATKIIAFMEEFKKNASNTLTIDLVNYVKRWLTDHMLGTDKKYVVYLRAAQAE